MNDEPYLGNEEKLLDSETKGEDAGGMVGTRVEVRDDNDNENEWQRGIVESATREAGGAISLKVRVDGMDTAFHYDQIKALESSGVGDENDENSSIYERMRQALDFIRNESAPPSASSASNSSSSSSPASPHHSLPKLLRLVLSHNMNRNFGEGTEFDIYTTFCAPEDAGLLELVEDRRFYGMPVWRGRAPTQYNTDDPSYVWLYRDEGEGATRPTQWRITIGDYEREDLSLYRGLVDENLEIPPDWPSELREGLALFKQADATPEVRDPREVGENGWDTWMREEKNFAARKHQVWIRDATGPDEGWGAEGRPAAGLGRNGEEGSGDPLAAGISAPATVDAAVAQQRLNKEMGDAGSAKDKSCVVCWEKQCNATIVHGETGHGCCCIDCAKELKRRNQPCPVCRESIDLVIRQFS